MIKYSRAINRINLGYKSKVSKTVSGNGVTSNDKIRLRFLLSFHITAKTMIKKRILSMLTADYTSIILEIVHSLSEIHLISRRFGR